MTHELLPIACTLGPAAGRERLERWRALHARAHPVVRRDPHRLELRYDDLPGVREELGSLAAAESQCCSFVTWTVAEVAGSPTLVVAAPADNPDALDAIVTVFGA